MTHGSMGRANSKTKTQNLTEGPAAAIPFAPRSASPLVANDNANKSRTKCAVKLTLG